jgi:hypothetical protein
LQLRWVLWQAQLRRLLLPDRDLASNETRALLEKWGWLHAVRSLLSLAASMVFICALLRA